MTRDKPAVKPSVRVFIIDDHQSVLWGLERLVGGRKTKMDVVGTATSATRALEDLAEAKPDVILLDIDLGAESGLDAMPDLLASSPARIVVLTGTRDRALRDQAVLAGARGIVGKEEPPENIIRAIEKVNAGEIWLDRSTTGRIFVEFSRRAKGGSPQSEDQKRITMLTARERQIVRMLTNEPETSITALAKKIHTSEHTLRNHLTSIYNKLGLTGRLQLHIFASKHRLG